MKRLSIISLFVVTLLTTIEAQQVNTLYFLENAPMRHLFNPAFQPVSRIYVGVSPLSYTSLTLGNNALTLKDLIYKDGGQYVTALYQGNESNLRKRLKRDVRMYGDMDAALLNFGFRIKEKGYFHFSITAKVQSTQIIPGNVYDIFSSKRDIYDPYGRVINLDALSSSIAVYTEYAAGYSHKINDQWTVGGKFKFLYGNAYLQFKVNDAKLEMHPDELTSYLDGDLYVTMPMKLDLPPTIKYSDIQNITDYISVGNSASLLKPVGYGAAFDLGATYRPHPQVELSLAVTDLGFIRWNKINAYAMEGNYTDYGPVVQYSELFKKEEENNNTGSSGGSNIDEIKYKATENVLIDTVANFLLNFAKDRINATLNNTTDLTRMINAKLNFGVDATFFEKKLGVGLHSLTTFRGNKAYEELTLGVTTRPVNWFNFALTYSLLNGKWNSLGAGISIMTYEGINMTLAADYIPFTYADLKSADKHTVLPYKMKGLNLAMGFTIVIGTNPKKEKKTTADDMLAPTEKPSEPMAD
ncbi:MAG: hypothetical protein IJS00_04630 [Paludibacteraceae bacterium]|nr:hypothetical protein [Paludibacteraceae bacterium]